MARGSQSGPGARRLALVVLGAAVLGLIGCEVTRQAYEAVSLGQAADQVKKVLGSPRYETPTEWVYTRDDPRDLTKVSIWFGPDRKVVGKAWQNPEKPWENHREGRAP